MTVNEIYDVMEENGFGMIDLIKHDYEVFLEETDQQVSFEEWCLAYAR